MAGRCRTTGLTKYPSKQRAERALAKTGGSFARRCLDAPSHWHVMEPDESGEDPARLRFNAADWDQATLALWARCRDRCEWCGRPLAGDMARHHRQRRAIGKDRLANLVALHTDCHRYVHGHPTEAMERGAIVSSYADDPAAVELILPGGRPVLLDDDGVYLPAA